MKKPTQQELELIGALGGKSLHDLTSNYSSAEIEVMEERFLLEKELYFWELGYRYRWLLFAVCCIPGFLGFLFADKVHNWVLSMNFSNAWWYSVAGFALGLFIFSLADIGRTCFFFKSRKNPEEVDHAITKIAQMIVMKDFKKGGKKPLPVPPTTDSKGEEKELVEEVAEEAKEEEEEEEETKITFSETCTILTNALEASDDGLMTTDEVIDALQLQIVHKSVVGRALSACNFVQKKTKTDRFWCVKKAAKNVNFIMLAPTGDA